MYRNGMRSKKKKYNRKMKSWGKNFLIPSSRFAIKCNSDNGRKIVFDLSIMLPSIVLHEDREENKKCLFI